MSESKVKVLEVEVKASDRSKGMTLAEVAEVVQMAYRQDFDPKTSEVKVYVGFKAQIQKIKVIQREKTR